MTTPFPFIGDTNESEVLAAQQQRVWTPPELDAPPRKLTVLALTLSGSVDPDFEADEKYWTIENFAMANDSRVLTKRTYSRRGYYTQGVGIEPSTMNLALQYAPGGIRELPFPRRLQDWWEPLQQLKSLRNQTVTVRIGTLIYGTWVLRSCPFDFQHNRKYVRKTLDASIAPRIVKCGVSLTAVDDSFYLEGRFNYQYFER